MVKKTSSGTGPLVGWFKAGSNPEDYECGVDEKIAHQGSRSGFIWSRPNPEGFGTLMQMFKADEYRGKRHRLSAYIRAESVEHWAGLWMRVDGANGRTLAFDNMEERPIRDTIEWCNYRVVLDVPEEAQYIAFGVLLEGPGRIWIDDVTFDVVDENVAVTSVAEEWRYPSRPTNLDFEQQTSSL